MKDLTEYIRPGDTVTLSLPAGYKTFKQRTGKAVIVTPGHVVINLGGRHGTPGVGTEDNIVKVVNARKPKAK